MRRLYLLFALFVSVIILFTTTTVYNWLIKRDINFICSFFKEQNLFNTDGSLSPSKSEVEIEAKVRQNILMSAVKQIWMNATLVEPAKRYSNFKNSADHLLKEAWDCKPMEDYFQKKM